jgi:hypothetical protein
MKPLIVDWSEIDEQERYIVFPVNQYANQPMLYLGNPNTMAGWMVKRLTPFCYVAMPIPDFDTGAFRLEVERIRNIAKT